MNRKRIPFGILVNGNSVGRLMDLRRCGSKRDLVTVEFKDRFKAARLAKGLAQAELSRLCGVKQGTISRWEGKGGGRKRPHPDDVLPAAKALGVSVDYLLTGRDDAYSEAQGAKSPREAGRDFFRATATHDGRGPSEVDAFLLQVADEMHMREDNSPSWWHEFYREEFRKWRAQQKGKVVGVRAMAEEDDES